MTRLWWLSFCDPNKPTGTQFLGALALEVPEEIKNPVQYAWLRGLNPGGEVMFMEIPVGKYKDFPPEFRNRLLTREEAESLWAIRNPPHGIQGSGSSSRSTT